ncbi:hypothetical protein MCOR17_006030 [Pyricularia oryzae]|nr:hypothetical protein MCOR17_006030 [Pyricularia oryzae]
MDVSSTGFHVRQGDQPGVTAAETKWANEMSRNKTSFPLFDQAGRISGIIKPKDHLMEACEFGPGRAQGHQIFEEIKTFPSYGNDISPEIEINRKPYEYYNVLWLGRWREEKDVRVGERLGVGRVFSARSMSAIKETPEVVIS